MRRGARLLYATLVAQLVPASCMPPAKANRRVPQARNVLLDLQQVVLVDAVHFHLFFRLMYEA